MARISENSILNISEDWGLDSRNNLPYSGKAVQDFIKSQFLDQQATLENKFGYSVFEGGKLIFYDKEGGTEITSIQFSGTNYIVDFGTAKNLTVLTSDEEYLLPITPKTYSIELGSTDKEPFVEDYTFKLEVDTGKGFVDQNIQDNKIKYEETKYIDIRKSLVIGINRVRVTVTGDRSEQSKSIVYTATLTSLTLDCKHTWNNVWFEGKEYKINNIFFSGNVSKTLHVQIEDTDYTQNFTANSEYKNVPYEFDVTQKLPSGGSRIIPVKIWIESENVKTKVYSFNIMYIKQGDEKPLICINNVPEEVYNFEQSDLFTFAVYNLQDVTIEINSEINGTISTVIDPYTLNNLQPQYRYTEKVSLNINTELTEGLYIIYNINGISGKIPLNNSNAYLAEPGATFYMNPSLRSNRTDDREQWYNSANNTKLDAIWNKFTFSDDAWLSDQNDNRALVVKAGSEVIVPGFKPFLPTDGNSKTFEFMFKVSNIADYDTPILTVTNTETFDINNKDCVGLALYPTKLLVITDGERQELFQQLLLSEDRIIHLAIVVQRNYASNSSTNLIRIFINGCENVTFSIQNSSKLYNNSDYNYLRIGQQSSDFYLYNMRLYEKALSGQQLVANYLNALIESEELSRRGIKNDNDILDGGVVSYDICKAKGYNTLVIETDKDIPSLDTPNTSGLRVNVLLEYNDHPEWNVKINNTPIDGQGTTSSKYAKWNLRNKVDKEATWIYPNLENKTEPGKEGYLAGYGLNPKVSKITFKKNIASQPQGHKMGATSFYNDLFMKVLGEVYVNQNLPAGARVAVYQHPFVGFQKFSDGTYKFIGLYTGGPDKTDKKTFGYNATKDYPNLMMIEGPNHDPLLTRFLTPWNEDVFYDKKQETLSIGDPTKEYQEGWDADIAGDFDTEEDNILPLYESEFKPAYDAIYFNSVYIASLAEANALNILDDNFDVSKFQEGNTTITLPDNSIITINNKLLSFYDDKYNLIYYRFKTKKYEILSSHNLLEYLKLSGTPTTTEIISARLNQWKEKVGNFVSLYEVYYHSCFCELIGASDNDAKNTYWRKFKAVSINNNDINEGGLWGFQQDDLDTIFQNDNNGQDTKNYYAEHNDVNLNGGDIFQGRSSAFWTTMRICCKSELQDTMHKIVEQSLILAESLNLSKSTKNETLFNLIKYYFWDHSSKYFSATAYNEDTKWAYIDVWYKEPSKVYNNVPPLTQIHGDHFETEYDWVKKRIAYIFSKYQIGAYEAQDGDGYGTLEFTCAENYDLNITPAIAQYPRISYGGKLTEPSSRTLENETYVIPLEASGETALYIKGLDWIQSLGDLSNLKLSSRGGSTEIPFSVVAKRLQELNLGSDSPKFNCTKLELKSPSLEILNAKNINTLNTVVDLKECPRIREIDLSGTQIPEVKLPKGGRIEKLHLPETIKKLTLNNLQLLNDFYVESYENIETLYCYSNNSLEVLQNILNVENNQLTALGIVWDGVITVYDSTILTLLAKLTQKNGDNYVYTSAYIDEAGELQLDQTFKSPPNIQGKLYIDDYVYMRDVEDIVSVLNVQVEYNPDKVYIEFVDPVWEELVATTYGNGRGVTQEQLDKVTKLKSFQGNTTITHLNDLYKFRNLKTFDSYCFAGMTSLESINYPTTVTSLPHIGGQNIYGLSELIISSENVTEIPMLFFSNSKVEKFVLPNSVTTLGARSLEDNNFVDFVIGKSLSVINSIPRWSCENVYIDSVVHWLKIAIISPPISSSTKLYLGQIEAVRDPNKGNQIDHYLWDKLEGTGDYADKGEYEGKRQLVTTAMVNEALQDESITEIKNYAFYNCTQLEGELVIPSNITSIGGVAFSGCKNLTSVVIGDSVTEIKWDAFYNCSGLTSIEIPINVTSIENSVFIGCKVSKDFILKHEVKLGATCFKDVFSNCDLYIDTSKITMSGGNVFNGCKFNNVYIDDLQSLFKYDSLSLSFGSVSGSRTNVYVNNELLENVIITLPDGVTLVNESLKGTTIKTVKISEGATGFSGVGFHQSAITLLDLPSTFGEISGYVVMSTNLKTLIVRAITPNIFNVFGSFGATIYVPDESVEAYRTATGWSTHASKIFPIQKDSLPEEIDDKVIWSNIELTPGVITIPEIENECTFTKTNSDTIYSAIIDLENVDFIKARGIMQSSTNRFWALVDENNIVTRTSDVNSFYEDGLIPIDVDDKKMSKLVVNIDKSIYNDIYVKTGDASNYYVRFNDYAFQKLVADAYGDGIGVTQEQLDNVTNIPANKFSANTTVTKINDLYKFRNLTSIGSKSLPTNIKEVYIPSSVATRLWQLCNSNTIEKIIIGSYKIGELTSLCYYNGAIQNFVIPDSVVKLSSNCFYQAKALKNLYIGDKVSVYDANVFYGVSNVNIYISSVKTCLNATYNNANERPFGTLYLGKPEEIIENKGIYGDIVVDYDWDKLEQERVLVTTDMVNEVLQDESITEIKNYAFYNCTQLEGELVIPNNITSIGNYVFGNCVFDKIVIEDTSKIKGSLNSFGCKTKELHIDSVQNLFDSGIWSYGGYDNLAYTIYVNDSPVYEINLKYNGITTILGKVFKCSTIKKAIINEGFTDIAVECFYGCANLKFIDLPNTITNVSGTSIYANGVLICRAIIPPTVGNITVQTIYVPDESVEDYKVASGWSTYASKIKPLSEYVES